MVRTYIIFTVTLLALCVRLCAQDEFTPTFNPSFDVHPAPGKIEIDGRLDDSGWEDAARVVKFHEHFPGDQTKPPVETEAMMTYDNDNLYVAFICHDDPSKVRTFFGERDNIGGADNVLVMIDTYNNSAWAYEFGATPYGIQWDALWPRARGEDSSYDIIYYSKGMVTDSGWQVEFKIPFSSISFPDIEEQIWRVDFWRNHPRQQRYQMSWAAYDRDQECWPCQWGTMTGIKGVKPGRGLEVMPSFISHQKGGLKNDSDPSSEWHNGDIKGEPSLGLQYNLSSEMVAEVTVNPDFSQVESDAAQIEVNSTFALSLAEHRPFFQEGSDLFTTWFNVVYTRSINDPLFAGKFTGRLNNLNIAFLTAYDETSPIIIPLEERSLLLINGKSMSNILRLRQTFGMESHLGLLVTDRRFDNHGSGSVLSLDGTWKLNKNYKFEAQLLSSYTGEPDDTMSTQGFNDDTFDDEKHTVGYDGEKFWGYGIYASFERSGRHLEFDLDYWEKSPTMRADNGIEVSNNSRLTELYTGYNFYTESVLIPEMGTWIVLGRKWNLDGKRKDEWFRSGFEIKLPGQTYIEISYLGSWEKFRQVEFPGIKRFYTYVSTYFLDQLSFGMNYVFGRSIARNVDPQPVMGDEINFELWATIKPIDRLFIKPRYEYSRSKLAKTDLLLFEGYTMRTRIDFQLTREISFRFITQYDDFSKHWEFDPLITYQLNPFTLFYFGSTHDLLDYDNIEDVGLKQYERQFFLKIQYLWQI